MKEDCDRLEIERDQLNRQIGSAEEQLNTLAKAKAEAEKVSFAKAYDATLVGNPKLYQQYLEEKSAQRRVA